LKSSPERLAIDDGEQQPEAKRALKICLHLVEALAKGCDSLATT
jgi:hypothetical protein